MKFAVKLEANQYDDWPYVNYKEMKKLIKKLLGGQLSAPPTPACCGNLTKKGSANALPPIGVGDEGALGALAEPLLLTEPGLSARAAFLVALGSQLLKVQNFYMSELYKHQEALGLLVEQLTAGETAQSSERNESSLQRASTDLYRTLQHLRNYCILNYTGLLKLGKKFDKATPVPQMRLLNEWKQEVDTSSFTTHEELERICTELETAYANTFCDGSLQVARATLLVRKERPDSKHLFSLGFRTGFAAALTGWILWDLLIDTRVMNLRMSHHRSTHFAETQLPLFRAGGTLVLGRLCYAGCLLVWQRARINYEFMLDYDPRTNTNAVHNASAAMRGLVFYLLALLLYAKSLLGELPKQINPSLFPVGMLLFAIGSLVLPVREGRMIFNSLVVVVGAPFHPVNFASVLVGDLLTSLVKPLQDLAYSACYIGTMEWLLPYSLQGECKQSWIYQDVMVPLLCALPLWFRFMQCLRVFADTHKRVPALPNALKYAIALLVVVFGAVHPTLVAAFPAAHRDGLIHVCWLATYLVSTLYSFVWDVKMDWKLGDLQHGLLRERRMFREDGLYYAAIVLDLLLRFAWTASIVPHWISYFTEWDISPSVFEAFVMAVIISEICRRSMWAIFRLESEHLHNTEGFRRVDVIPLHFDHAPRNVKSGGVDSTDTPARKKLDVVLEMLVYATVVALLGFAAATRPLKSDGVDVLPLDQHDFEQIGGRSIKEK